MDDARSIPHLSKASTGVRVVGLGASAGGLGPLEQFLSKVPAASGLAYLVVQHMDPTHKTLLGELLQRATSIPVHEAVDAQRIEPNSVYVIAPDTELTVLGGALHLAKPVEPRGQRLPIDVLFCSLARELGERAIGVVLSGMGSDGTQGLQAIKTQGGADPGAAARVGAAVARAVRHHEQVPDEVGLAHSRAEQIRLLPAAAQLCASAQWVGPRRNTLADARPA